MTGKNYRSAKTGRFVTKKYAESHKATTLAEDREGGPTGRSRSAKTGAFVTKTFAKKHTATTVDEG